MRVLSLFSGMGGFDLGLDSIECCGHEMIVHERDDTDEDRCEVCNTRYIVHPSWVEALEEREATHE